MKAEKDTRKSKYTLKEVKIHIGTFASMVRIIHTNGRIFSHDLYNFSVKENETKTHLPFLPRIRKKIVIHFVF